jgi:hypothetical protein
MQHRGKRLALLCLILVTGALSGFFIWTTERGIRQLDAQSQSRETTADRLLSSIATIRAMQQSYIDTRSGDVASFARVSVVIDRMTTDAAGLRATVSSNTGTGHLEEFWTALSALMGAASRAREQFASGDEGTASETILAAARDHVTRLNSSLRAFRETEAEGYRRTRAASSWRSAATLGTTAAIWAVGLILFASLPLRTPAPAVESVPPSAVPGEPSIDLVALAQLSSALARLSQQDQLPALLGRAAEILDARGVVLWMGAGTELVAAAAHGYDHALLQRIRPIARSADNATADAWRTSEMRTVAADSSGYGAVVAPLLGPAECVGVLAAETRSGRENDDVTRAAATIIAAQLAGVLAAWPVASTTDMEPLNRKAAAS